MHMRGVSSAYSFCTVWTKSWSGGVAEETVFIGLRMMRTDSSEHFRFLLVPRYLPRYLGRHLVDSGEAISSHDVDSVWITTRRQSCPLLVEHSLANVRMQTGLDFMRHV